MVRCVGMRISRIEIRLRLGPGDWAVELWQWPHQEFVKQHKVKTALVAVQMGPVEVGFWIGKPGQYEIVPKEAAHGYAAFRPSC
jgi:hypothetical protein